MEQRSIGLKLGSEYQRIEKYKAGIWGCFEEHMSNHHSFRSKRAKEKTLVRSGTPLIPIICLAEKLLPVLQHSLRTSLGKLWVGKKLASQN